MDTKLLALSIIIAHRADQFNTVRQTLEELSEYEKETLMDTLTDCYFLDEDEHYEFYDTFF